MVEHAFLSYGDKNAPVKVEVFLNLACPYCATFFEAADQILPAFIEKGQVQYLIKHYDKPREMLLYGTLVNLFFDYQKPDKVYGIMKDLFKNQKQWSESDSNSIKKLLTEKYGLEEEPDTIELSLKITEEAIKRKVKMVPTVFINNSEFQFPVEIDAENLQAEIEKRV